MVIRKVTLPPYTWRAYAWPAGCWYPIPALFLERGLDSSGAFAIWGCQRECLEGRLRGQESPDTIADTLTDKDILTVKLHYDVTHPDHLVPSGMERLPDYEDTMALLNEVGPRLRGVLIGNQAGMELSYRHMYGAWRGNAIANVAAVAEYILSVGGMLRDMGIRPWFAAMDWDILQDAYKGDGRMLRALDSVGATNYVACGYASVPGAYIKHPFPYKGDHLRWQSALLGQGWRLPEEGQEFPLLRDYLREGNFWCGLCGPEGIRAGNMELLSAYGYKGFITRIPLEEGPKLTEELGEGWETAACTTLKKATPQLARNSGAISTP